MNASGSVQRTLPKRCPITALHTCPSPNLLLVGEGPYLRVQDLRTKDVLATEKVFDDQAIHGIVDVGTSNTDGDGGDLAPDSDGGTLKAVLLVWGGKMIALTEMVVSTNEGSTDVNLSVMQQLNLGDWIMTVAVESTGALGVSGRKTVEWQNGQAATYRAIAITAHNAAHMLSITVLVSTSSRKLTSDSVLSSHITRLASGITVKGLRTILYAAAVTWLSANRILVVAGTAFGEIVVWTFSIRSSAADLDDNASEPSDDGSVTVHHTFTGHEGSIFGVSISPLLASTRSTHLEQHTIREDVKLVLASCSDDRTIRLWDITDVLLTTKVPDEITEGDSQTPSNDRGRLQQANIHRETGFGANLGTTSHALCLATVMGHTSRIWRVDFLLEGSQLHLVSFGEDATTQTWIVHLDNLSKEYHQKTRKPSQTQLEQPWRIQHTSTHSYHAGKNVWAANLLREQAGDAQVITGGADGKIVRWKIKCHKKSLLKTLGVPISIYGALSHVKNDILRSFDFLDSSTIVLATNTGRIQKVSFGNEENAVEEHDQNCNVEELGLFDDLCGFSAIKRAPFGHAIFIASARGHVRVYRPSTGLHEIVIVNGNVTGLFVETWMNHDMHGLVTVLITRAGSLPPYHLLVDLSKGRIPSVFCMGQHELKGPSSLSIPRVLTSHYYADLGGFGQLAITGGRNGSIAIYLTDIDHPDANVTLLNRVHGEEAVTSVWFHVEIRRGWLFSVGRDGRLCVHAHDYFENTYQLVHALALPYGPMTELLYHDSDERLRFASFHARSFVIHDLGTGKELVRIPCEGSHRSWSFLPAEDSGKDSSRTVGTFAWTQAGRLHIRHVPEPEHEVLWAGGHGREVKAVAVAGRHEMGSFGGRKVIATGAEDTDIWIQAIGDAAGSAVTPTQEIDGSGFETLAVLRRHVTGIQALKWSEDGRFLFSSGGCEEFFVWRVSEVPLVGVGVVCEGVCPVESEVKDLRIMEFDVRQVARWHGDEDNHSGEVFEAFMIAMVYSDSTVKIWRYTTASTSSPHFPRWDLLHTGLYKSCCLTQALFLSTDTDTQPNYLLTAATDGHLAFWPLPPHDHRSQASALLDPDASEAPEPQEATKPTLITRTSTLATHQSAILSLTTHRLTTKHTLLLSTGDDNSLGLVLLELAPDGSLALKPSDLLTIPRAHAAAVTACALLPSLAASKARRVQDDQSSTVYDVTATTASTDQTVKTWDVRIDLEARTGAEGMDVRRGKRVGVVVADIGCLGVLPSRDGEDGEDTARVVVCGVGMEVVGV